VLIVSGAVDDTGNVVGREVSHPDAHETWVTVQQLQRGMCGDSRPHFFRGVATVSAAGCSALSAAQQLCHATVPSLMLRLVWSIRKVAGTVMHEVALLVRTLLTRRAAALSCMRGRCCATRF
jgi:hypothetical protein